MGTIFPNSLLKAASISPSSLTGIPCLCAILAYVVPTGSFSSISVLVTSNITVSLDMHSPRIPAPNDEPLLTPCTANGNDVRPAGTNAADVAPAMLATATRNLDTAISSPDDFKDCLVPKFVLCHFWVPEYRILLVSLYFLWQAAVGPCGILLLILRIEWVLR